MFLIGRSTSALRAPHHVPHRVHESLGSTKGAKVRVSGLDAGEVLTVEVPTPRRAVPSPLSNRREAAGPRPERFRRHYCQGGDRRRHLPVRSTGQQRSAASGRTGDDTECRADRTVRAPHECCGASRYVKGALQGATSAISNVNDVVVGIKEAVARPACCSATTRWRVTSAGQ